MSQTKAIQIAIDGNEANITQRVGSNVYAYQILSALEKLTRQQVDRYHFNILLAGAPLADMPHSREGWRYQVLKPTPFWTQWALPLHLFIRQKAYDVFFTPGHYAPRLSAVPYVSSVMDLAFLEYPTQFKTKDLIQLRDWTKYSVEHAQKVITISEFTKQEVIRQYHRQAEDIIVAYPAVEPLAELKPADQKVLLKKYGIQTPYILYVGTLQPRKNLLRLIEAFELTHQKLQVTTAQKSARRSSSEIPDKVMLVIAGKIGWLADDILQRIAQSPLADLILLTDYVDDTTKQALYQQATAAVLVGLYEGFGIPPLEALRAQTLPVVSKTSSLPEVVGSAGILVDPLDTKDIARGLFEAITLSSTQRAKLRRLARKQLTKFDWQRSAASILETLLKVVQTHS